MIKHWSKKYREDFDESMVSSLWVSLIFLELARSRRRPLTVLIVFELRRLSFLRCH